MFTNFEIMRKSPEAVIKFFFLSKAITLKRRKELKRFIVKAIWEEGYEAGAINYIFCSDDHLLEINRKYLNHDFYTDIITFQLSEKNKSIEAEIYISIDRVKENALKYKEPVSKELHRVIFHGALHLCGFRDKKSNEIARMRRKENEWLKKYS